MKRVTAARRNGPAPRVRRLCQAMFMALMGAATLTSAAAMAGDEGLMALTVGIDRTPKQPWHGNGVYLGDGLIITAAHVAGHAAFTKPKAVVAGRAIPTTVVREGSLETVDLTLLSTAIGDLPADLGARRLPVCESGPEPGDEVIIVTADATARSRILPPEAIPDPAMRARFGTIVADETDLARSGNGVIAAASGCLAGIVSRRISHQDGREIAKYFVPAGEISDFIGDGRGRP